MRTNESPLDHPLAVAVIGTGYVGLVSGACLARFGHRVTCVDKDEAKIDGLRAGVMPIYEPGLAELVAECVAAGTLRFATDLPAAVDGADIALIAVGTPSRPIDGHADLSGVFAVARAVALAATGPLVIVDKSTVPVGTADEVAAIAREAAPRATISVASNPEFLREGVAIDDFQHPDRVVVGTSDALARARLDALYAPLAANGVPIIHTDPRSAELAKYAANGFLAMKITFINEIADLCERLDGDVQDVARAIGHDARIGSRFLQPGPGYGGSCFPKDTMALMRTAARAASPVRLLESTIAINDDRKRRMAEKVAEAAGGDLTGRRVAVLGLTFKPGTDDMRAAPSLTIVPLLLESGASVIAYDPEGVSRARECFGDGRDGLSYAPSAMAALEGADVAVLMTEWDEFLSLDLAKAANVMRAPVMVDLRNAFDPETLRAHGFHSWSIGRPLRDVRPAPAPAPRAYAAAAE